MKKNEKNECSVGDERLTADSTYVAPRGGRSLVVGTSALPSAGSGRGIVVAGHLKLVQTAISPRYVLRGDRSWLPTREHPLSVRARHILDCIRHEHVCIL